MVEKYINLKKNRPTLLKVAVGYKKKCTLIRTNIKKKIGRRLSYLYSDNSNRKTLSAEFKKCASGFLHALKKPPKYAGFVLSHVDLRMRPKIRHIFFL